MKRLQVGGRAAEDIDRVLVESADRHGAQAALRYERLIAAAFDELRRDPGRPATCAAGMGGLRLYPLRFTARRMPTADAVRSPPHVIAYRFDAEAVMIVRLLHEAMDLPARLRDGEG